MWPFIHSFRQAGWIAAYQPAYISPLPVGRGKQSTLRLCFLEPRWQKEQPKENKELTTSNSRGEAQWPFLCQLTCSCKYILESCPPSRAALVGPGTPTPGTLSLVLVVSCSLAAHLHRALGGFICPSFYAVGLLHCCILYPLIWRIRSVKEGTKSFLILYSSLLCP